jgi:hypothetical protein
MLLKPVLLFLIGCIGIRFLFVFIAKYINPVYLPYLGVLALLPVLGWGYIYFISPRNTGPEVFGGKIWWNQLRPVHMAFYLLFALFAIQKLTFAYLPLLADVIFGLISFIIYHYY